MTEKDILKECGDIRNDGQPGAARVFANAAVDGIGKGELICLTFSGYGLTVSVPEGARGARHAGRAANAETARDSLVDMLRGAVEKAIQQAHVTAWKAAVAHTHRAATDAARVAVNRTVEAIISAVDEGDQSKMRAMIAAGDHAGAEDLMASATQAPPHDPDWGA